MDPKQGVLWFFADQTSAMYANRPNCVSLRYDEYDYSVLDKCESFIKQFSAVLIVPNRTEDREDMIDQIRRRVSYIPLLVAQEAGYIECESIRDLIDKHGQKALDKLLFSAKELPAYGLIDIADVTPLDVSRVPRTLSGIKQLDHTIGGFYEGDVSVWTGKRGEGKSTFLSQLLIEAREQGKIICAYSGELKADRFKNWLYLQAAGSENILTKADKNTGRELPVLNAYASRALNEWFREHLFLYDLSISSAHDADSIIKVFEYAARRYSASVFLVDNIMTARFKASSDANFYRAQSNFVGRLVEFANHFGAHVHIVAHPRKGEIRDGDDVSGISDITNRSANVFSIARLSEKDAELKGFDSVIAILKCREHGDRAQIGLKFESKSKRFYHYKDGSPDKKYGWEPVAEQATFEALPDDYLVPFEKGG